LQSASVAITAPGDSGKTGILPRSAGVLENRPETAGNLAIAAPRVSQAETDDRAADNWRPLLAIADVAGGRSPGRGAFHNLGAKSVPAAPRMAGRGALRPYHSKTTV
jgi:hypothetical protein